MVFDVCLKNFVDVVGGFICDQVDWALSKGGGLAANIVFNLIVVACDSIIVTIDGSPIFTTCSVVVSTDSFSNFTISED